MNNLEETTPFRFSQKEGPLLPSSSKKGNTPLSLHTPRFSSPSTEPSVRLKGAKSNFKSAIRNFKTKQEVLAFCHAHFHEMESSDTIATFEELAKKHTHQQDSQKITRKDLSFLIEAIIPQIPTLSPDAVVSLTWPFEILEIVDKKLFQAIAEKASQDIEQFDGYGLVTLARSFSHLQIRHQPLFAAIAKASPPKLNEMLPKALVRLAVSFATLNYCNEELFREIAKVSIDKIQDFSAADTVYLAEAFVKLNIRNEKLFLHLADHCLANKCQLLREMLPKLLSLLVWAFASANIHHGKLLSAVAQEFLRKIQEEEGKQPSPQDLSLTAWGFATFKFQHPHLFDVIAKKSLEKIHTFPGISLTLMALAYENIPCKDQNVLFHAIAKEWPKKNLDPEPADSAKTAWAFAKVGIKNLPLLKAIAERLLARRKETSPYDLSLTAWSFSLLGFESLSFLEAIAEESIGKISKFYGQDLELLAVAYTHFRYKHEKLFAAITKRTSHIICSCEPKHLVIIPWAFAHLGFCHHEAFFDAISKECIRRNFQGFTLQDYANIGWAFSVSDIYDPSLFSAMTRKLDGKSIKGNVEEETIRQLYHTFVWLKHKKFPVDNQILSSLEEKVRRFSQHVITSALQKSVGNTLKALNLSFEEEVSICGYELDIVLKQQKITIDVKGPSHFTINTGEMLGSDFLREALLSFEGWTVIEVSYKEWDPLDDEQRKTLLKEKLFLFLASETSSQTISQPSKPSKKKKKRPAAVTQLIESTSSTLQKEPQLSLPSSPDSSHHSTTEETAEPTKETKKKGPSSKKKTAKKQENLPSPTHHTKEKVRYVSYLSGNCTTYTCVATVMLVIAAAFYVFSESILESQQDSLSFLKV